MRLTPQRLVYLIFGIVIGAALFAGYISIQGVPRFLPSLAVGPTPAPSPSGVTQAFTGSSLVKVLSVNQQATKNGVILRINGFEQYADGFSLTYSLLSGQSGEPAQVLQPEQFGVTDDRGVSYRLTTVASSSTAAPGLGTGYLSFSPGLSPEAKFLTVTVPHALIVTGLADSSSPKVIDGPWQVQVPVR